jgi:hypothetical protein
MPLDQEFESVGAASFIFTTRANETSAYGAVRRGVVTVQEQPISDASIGQHLD